MSWGSAFGKIYHIRIHICTNSLFFCSTNRWVHTYMNSYIHWIHLYKINEFIQLLYVWIHLFYEFIYTKYMNSLTCCMYEFIYSVNSSVQKKKFIWLWWGGSPNCERVAQTARANPEPRGQSLSTPPAPTRPHPAAPTVRVHPTAPTRPCPAAPTIRVHPAAPIVRVHSTAPIVRVHQAAPNS